MMRIYFGLLFVFIAYTVAQNDYPLVTVDDTPGIIEGGTQKIYKTVLRLRRKLSTSSFVALTFRNSMFPLYEEFQGILDLVNIENEQISQDIIEVSYDVLYVFAILKNDATDSAIVETIGNFEALRTFLDSSGSDTNRLFAMDDPSFFSFQGESLCGVPGVCGGNLVCTEVLNGVTITCTSQCKLNYCLNNGTCEQSDINQIPTCTCPSTSNLWYLGARCETFVALWMLITGIVCAFILIVVILVISCWIYHLKRRKKEKLAFSEFSNGVSNNGFVNDEKETTIVVTDVAKSEPKPQKDTFVYTVSSADRDTRSRRRRDSSYSRRGHRHERRYRDDESSRSRRSRKREREPTVTRSVGDSAPEEDARSISSEEANDVSVVEKGTSPIVWKIPESTASSVKASNNKNVDIATRRGWKPSLGPDMFNLGSQISGFAPSETTSSRSSRSRRNDYDA